MLAQTLNTNENGLFIIILRANNVTAHKSSNPQ